MIDKEELVMIAFSNKTTLAFIVWTEIYIPRQIINKNNS